MREGEQRESSIEEEDKGRQEYERGAVEGWRGKGGAGGRERKVRGARNFIVQ